MKRKLGKLPARPDSVKFKFTRYADKSSLPKPPIRFGTKHLPTSWGVLGNDKYGNCVWAGAAHEEMDWSAACGAKIAAFSDKSVLSDYSAATGFNPRDPDNTDNGTDMQEAASYRRKVGIKDASGKRHKIDAYVGLRIGDPDELALAAYLFGAVGVGIQFPRIADQQFAKGQPWDIKPGQSSQIDGGHYIPVIGRNTAGNFLLVTWGRLQAMTPRFYVKYCDEVIVYLSKSIVDNRLISPEGFDYATLQRDLAQLS